MEHLGTPVENGIVLVGCVDKAVDGKEKPLHSLGFLSVRGPFSALMNTAVHTSKAPLRPK